MELSSKAQRIKVVYLCTLPRGSVGLGTARKTILYALIGIPNWVLVALNV